MTMESGTGSHYGGRMGALGFLLVRLDKPGHDGGERPGAVITVPA